MDTENEPGEKASRAGLELVEALHRLGTATAPELADALSVPVRVVESHLSLLEEGGHVIYEDGAYRNGFRFLEYGGKVRNNAPIFRQGRPKVDELAKETGELANLMVEERGRGVHIYLAKGEDALLFDTHAGKRFYLHNNALGKAILSGQSEETVDAIIDRHGLVRTTENTVTDPEELKTELSTIRERGYALDDEERLEGLRCVAAPVFVDGEVTGSISVSGPASRIKDEYFRETLPREVIRTADLIGLNISYS